jgi:hypothetical protein
MRRGLEYSHGALIGRYIQVTAEGFIWSCPLGTAFLGTLYGPDDVAKFTALVGNSSDESISNFILMGLHKAHPEVGVTVRHWPKLAGALEQQVPTLVPRARFGDHHRQEIHPSLFKVISQLHDRHDWKREAIADMLERVGL